jgi:replicative DNA helicase
MIAATKKPVAAPPHNVQAEEGVIGCLVLAPREVLPRIASIVSGEQFFDVDLGKLFTVCAYLAEAGKPIDNARWLLGELPKHGVKIDLATLMRLFEQQPHYGHAVDFAEQVRDTSRLRKFSSIGARLLEMSQSHGAEPRDIESWLDGQLQSARHGDQSGDELLGDVMQRVVSEFDARLKSGNKPVLLSGFPAADNCGFVFAAGELTVLAARTGMGKTTLATQVGMHHAAKGRCVLMASLEMKSTEVAGRLLAAASGNNYQSLRIGQFDDICVNDMRAAANKVGDLPFRLWSPGRVKVGQIHAMASMRKATHNIELLIVDLLQCVKWDDPRDEEHHAYGKITKGLRDIAQQLQIPVMLVAQLSRGAEGERPSLKHLKGSGAIEEDADIVALLHAEKRKSETVELIVEKNRFGAPGSTSLTFVARESRFADPSAEVQHHRNYRPEFA